MKTSSVFLIIVLVGFIAFGIYFLNREESGRSEITTESRSDLISDTQESPNADLENKDEVTQDEPAKPAEQRISVSGAYTYSEDPESKFVGKICFKPVSSNLALFCFSNADEAFAIFGIQKGFSDGSDKCTVEGEASVEIKNYQKLTGEVGGYDSAIITKVISSSEQKFLLCES